MYFDQETGMITQSQVTMMLWHTRVSSWTLASAQAAVDYARQIFPNYKEYGGLAQ
jgi:hypothetical protein